MSRGNEPAYPGKRFPYHEQAPNSPGMTLREHFAGLAMQGLSANAHEQVATRDVKVIAEWAVLQADALLDELTKDEP